MTGDTHVHAALVDFETALSRQGLATRGRYFHEAKKFVLWIESRTGAFVPGEITGADVAAYCREVASRRKASGGGEVFAMLRRFFECLKELGTLSESPLKDVNWSDVRLAVPSRGAPTSTGRPEIREGWRELERLERTPERRSPSG